VTKRTFIDISRCFSLVVGVWPPKTDLQAKTRLSNAVQRRGLGNLTAERDVNMIVERFPT
jgi:hypothetical protein